MPKASKHTFVLNDESQVNAYGFRVPNAALKLERFNANPVVLDSHNGSTGSVVGRWENLRTEGSKMLADAVFDMGDKDAQKLAGKVERGFVKGCSIGFIPLGMKKAKDGVPELVSGELMEASICAVPANATALKLYAPDGSRLTADEIKLSVSASLPTTPTPPKTPTNSMKGLILSFATLSALGFQKALEDGDESRFAAGLERLSADYLAAQAKVTALEAQLATTVKLQSKALLDAAETDGRFLPVDRPKYEKLAGSDYELCADLIAKMPAKTNLSNQVNNPAAAGGAPADLDAFLKLSIEEQLAFKKNQPALYANLVK